MGCHNHLVFSMPAGRQGPQPRPTHLDEVHDEDGAVDDDPAKDAGDEAVGHCGRGEGSRGGAAGRLLFARHGATELRRSPHKQAGVWFSPAWLVAEMCVCVCAPPTHPPE